MLTTSYSIVISFQSFLALNFIETLTQQMKLFIDLGSPSVIETNLTERDGVLRLEDIFRQSAKLNIEKMEKVNKAKNTILLLAQKRSAPTLLAHHLIGRSYSLPTHYKIGTRGSLLALTQCGQVKDQLEKITGDTFELVTIKTQGDIQTSQPLWQMEGNNFFTRKKN